MLTDGLYKYRHQIVRDLAWVIFSPVLLHNIPVKKFCFDNGSLLTEGNKWINNFLRSLDNDPRKLKEYIAKENSKLIGKYFENLVKFWLEHGQSSHELVSSNLQINSNGRTIGEFDFILKKNNNNGFIHLEVAGKFYLAYRNIGEWSNFIGPNGIDNLHTKLEKLQKEQMLLSGKPDSVKTLKTLGINKKLEKIILLKGYIFYNHKHYFGKTFIPPIYASENHLKGWWIRFNEINDFFKRQNSKWFIVERKNWVSRVYDPSPNQIFTSETLVYKLQEYFGNNSYPILVAQLDISENGILYETSRGFIVSNNWPNDNRK